VIVYRAYRRKFYKEDFHGVFTTIEGAKQALELGNHWESAQRELEWQPGKVRVRGYGTVDGLVAEHNWWHYEIVPTPLDEHTVQWQDFVMSDEERAELNEFHHTGMKVIP